MADDDAAAVVAVAALVEIQYGVEEFVTLLEVIQKIQECVSHDQQIDLELVLGGDFGATVALENTIVRNSRHIHKLRMYNAYDEKEEHDTCFTFCTQLIRGLIGEGKLLLYESSYFAIELEQANQLVGALQRSNNNNDNNAVESFSFDVPSLMPVVFQPVLNALLDSGVRKIKFGNFTDVNSVIFYNSIIDFTSMNTNISLKELDLCGFVMQTEDCQNLFTSMKVNKGLTKLKLHYWDYDKLPTQMKRLFEEMLLENITLLDFIFENGNGDDPIIKMIQFHTKLNRMWKRYIIMKRNAESTVAAMAVSAGAGIDIDIGIAGRVRVRARARATTMKANNNGKKWLKMRMLLNLFIQKPVLRNTMIFHLLREYPDDLVSNNNNNNNEHQQQNSPLLRIISSNLGKNKRKRTTDDEGDK